jgi:hypothetical protein
MVDDDRNNLIIEAAHRRMDSVESMLSRLTNNPAPTVPQYDLQVAPAAPTTATIITISAFIYKISSPADDATITVCADDAGGTVPGTALGSIAVDGIVGGGWTTPVAPSPSVTMTIGDNFWLLFDRTATKHAGGSYYRVGYADSGDGVSGINPAHGFQWMDQTNTWFSFSTNKLAVSLIWDDGNSNDNISNFAGGITFGWGDQTSLLAASKFIVP